MIDDSRHTTGPRDDSRIPVTVITGYLGSGKTTLLNELLQHAQLARTFVLFNEYGEIPIDHQLVRQVSDRIAIMPSGCLCCQVHGELLSALTDLFRRALRREIPRPERVVLETSGLADPGPIIQTLHTDFFLRARFRLDAVLTVVDGLHLPQQLETAPEVMSQITAADALLVSKLDLTDPGRFEQAEISLRRLNPLAEILRVGQAAAEPDRLLRERFHAPAQPTFTALAADDDTSGPAATPWLTGHDRHDAAVRSVCLRLGQPVSWADLRAGFDRLQEEAGEALLRAKGILTVRGREAPVVIHAVHHQFHTAEASNPNIDPALLGKLVFITRNLPEQRLTELLGEHLLATEPQAAAADAKS